MNLLLIISLWVAGCGLLVYLICKHFIHTKEFNPLWFTLDKEQQEADKRGVKPCIEPTEIPKAYYRSYYRDFFIAILVVVVLVILIF